MTKIPVGETIRYAYRFTFGHLGVIIGLIWLPMVLVTVAGFFAGQNYYADADAALAQGNFAAMGPSILMMLVYLVLALLFYAMMYVAVTEFALGTRKAGTLVHFAFGQTEWRMFRAFVALIGLLLVPAIIILAGAGLANAMLGPTLGKGPASLAVGGALLIFDLAYLYVALRFVFLLAPVAVAEEGRVLERAWTLTAGNFWRLLAVFMAVALPLLLVTLGAQISLLGPSSMFSGLNPSAGEAAIQIHRMRTNMPFVTGISFLVSPLMLGLILGAASYAYRTLTGTGDTPAIPPP